MRLLLINPNISDSVSELIRAEAARSASAGTEVEVLTAPFGVAYIETRFEALIGAYATAQLACEHADRYDAVVVAAFGDPGLAGLREVLPVPVTGTSSTARSPPRPGSPKAATITASWLCAWSPASCAAA